MMIGLDEACDCGRKALPGYMKHQHRLCMRCELFIVHPMELRWLKRLRKLSYKSRMDDRVGSIASKAAARAEHKRAKEEA